MQEDRILSAARGAAVLVGIFLCGAVCLAQAPPSPRKVDVADVLVTGNRRMSTQSIMSRIRTRPGSEYSPEVIREDVRELMATRQFGNVVPRVKTLPDGRVQVTFEVFDYPSAIQRIEYRGLEAIKTDELNTLTGIRKGSALNPIVNQIACQGIVRRLNEQGYPLASCTLLKGATPGDTEVIFNVTEGPKVYVRDVLFEGNDFVSGAVLNTHINTSKKFLGKIKWFARPYNPGMVDNDVNMLRDYYRSYGFHDVRVSREIQWSPDGHEVVVVFHIQEGIRYRVKDGPQVMGNSHFTPPELERLASLRQGEFYDQRKVEGDLSRIKDYIGYSGRQAAVQDRVYFTGPGLVTVHYEVQERPPARVGHIFIQGNTTTKQNVILRQVPLFPGQPLSYPALREAERNLARTQLFETNPQTGVRPTVTVLDPDSDTPFKDILIEVQEARTGSLLFGAGFNSDAGVTGSIVLNERNFDLFRLPTSFEDLLSGMAFRGAGQELRIEAVPGNELQRYTISFREPFLFDSPYSLTVGGYYYTRLFDEYDERRLGSRVTIGRRLNDYWTVTGTLRVEDVEVRRVPFFAPNDFQDVRGHNFQAGFRAGVVYDDRDSYLRPTEGSLLDISYEQITGDRTFPLFNVDYNKYWTVWQRADGSGRHVLAFHSQFGIAGSNAPVYERFYAGGFRSIRGFEFRGVGPDVNGFKVGGETLLLNSLEYQVPVKADDQLFVVAFVDSGTVERDLELKDYRVSAGFGVRFIVPMLGPVPIALDFGFPIVKGPRDREQIFSFWLGFFR